jgi:hypothetical protein
MMPPPGFSVRGDGDPNSLVLEIHRRLNEMNDATALSKDAVVKTLRSYRTRVHPILRERLSTLMGTSDDVSTMQSSRSGSYRYQSVEDQLNGQGFSNFAFQPVWDIDEPSYNRIIKVKCSHKTKSAERFGDGDMERAVKEKLRQFSDEHGIADFREICLDELGVGLITDLLQPNFAQSTFARAVVNFLENHHFTFPCDRFLTVRGRRLPISDLVMDSKYYISRSDFRAYVKDRNLLRHLSGCCLHRVFQPKSLRAKLNLHRQEYLPAMDKDVLELRLILKPECVTRLIIIDISNFTGSAGNSWLMLFTLALQLSTNESWEKEDNLYQVNDTFFRASMRELLIIYLYHVVGVGCQAPGYDCPQFLPGGFLGVAANITIGLVWLCVVLRNLHRMASKRELVFVSQAGGDDTGILIHGNRFGVESFIEEVRFHMENYVGACKEFSVYNLDGEDPGFIRGARFCKKRVFLARGGGMVYVRGERSIPVPECLSTNSENTTIDIQETLWRSLDLDLLQYERTYPFYGEHCDYVRSLFLDKHPHMYPLKRLTTTRAMRPNARYIRLGCFDLTNKAMTAASRVPSLMHVGNFYLLELEDKVFYLLSIGVLLRFDVVKREGLKMNLIMMKTEAGRILEYFYDELVVGV